MGYLITGLIWCLWLEWYTTNKVDGVMNREWLWRERIYHTFLWPLSLGSFVYFLLRGE